MKLVYKYSNRKLYSKDDKRFISLRELVQDPNGYRVICHKTKRDLTQETQRKAAFYYETKNS